MKGQNPQVIFNADDFGRSPAINAAVIQAHQQGVLTSASLMVAGEAWQEAVELARAHPTLAVGLHLMVSNGPAVLPHRIIPHITSPCGRLRDDPLQAGLYYGFSQAARQELEREIEAQFARFAGTGLPLSHVDGHQHLHVHPAIFPLVLRLAQEYGARGMRLPREDMGLTLRLERRQSPLQVLWTLILRLLCRWCAGRMQGVRLAVPARVFGTLQSGRMHERYVVGVLRNIRHPSAELYFHPTLDQQAEPLGPNRGDWQTLLSPAVRQVIAERGLRPATYAELAEGG
jgi:hopanoid biosynthesis associated protein HpnK